MEQLLKQLEENRQNFLKLFKRTKLINVIVLAIIIVTLGLTFVFLFETNQNLALIIIVALIIAMYVYSRSMKAWLGKKTYEYIFSYYRATSSFYYGQRPFADIEISEKEGFDVEEFKTLGLLQNVSGIISRNTVKGKWNQLQFQVADAGVRVERNKKIEVAFFGKIFKLETKQAFGGTYIIHHRAKSNQPLPDGFELLKAIEENDDLIIVGSDETLPKEISKTLLAKFKKIAIDEDLLDATLVFTNHFMYVLLSYNDSVMNVVYEKEVDGKPFARFEQDLSIIGDIATSFSK